MTKVLQLLCIMPGTAVSTGACYWYITTVLQWLILCYTLFGSSYTLRPLDLVLALRWS